MVLLDVPALGAGPSTPVAGGVGGSWAPPAADGDDDPSDVPPGRRDATGSG